MEPPPCPGCRIPAPDALPSPSVPSEAEEEEVTEEELAPGAPVLPGEGAPTEPLPGSQSEPEAESPPAAE